jgi:hypothetical protein
MQRKKTPVKLLCLLTMVASVLMVLPASATSAPWEQPAAALAEQIAGILGPGQAHLTIRNNSKISTDEIPAIRRALEDALKARGVEASGAESANAIRITLSENIRERLWVAEIVEGNETRLAMIRVEAGAPHQEASTSEITLHKQAVLTTTEPVLTALEIADSYVVIEPEEMVTFARSASGWKERNHAGIGQKKPLARDPRGVIFPSPDGQGFMASVAGMACSGSDQHALASADWSLHCRESDDPWSLTPSQPADGGSAASENFYALLIHAFYNAGRNYFTGVVTPSLGADLPPFYNAVPIPRPDGTGLLINGIDGKVQLVEAATLKPIAGTRDWGSDFAALHSGCGTGTQIIVSGSGEATSDSLRIYDLPAQEAIPASTALTMEGTVTALWTAPDSKSVFAVVRKPASPGYADTYEVDRVTASCN